MRLASGLHDIQIFVNPLDQVWKGQLFLVVQTGCSLKLQREALQQISISEEKSRILGDHLFVIGAKALGAL